MCDLHAYFVQRGFRNNRMVIVPMQIPYHQPARKASGFVERVVPRRDFHFRLTCELVTRAAFRLPDEDTFGSC